MVKSFMVASLCVLVMTVIVGAQAPPSALVSPAVNSCRTKIYSPIGPAHLISPEGFRVTVPMKDAAAARAQGFKEDRAALIEQAQEYRENQQSEEQAILAKLSDEQLTSLYSDIATCVFKYRDTLSRDDLLNYGIAMAEIASARQYRTMGHLLVTNDEERVKKYNDLAAKYNELLKTCGH
jgi:hypothetical protein